MKNKQVVLLTHSGFIGKALSKQLRLLKIGTTGLSSKNVDLRKPESLKILSQYFNSNLILIITASINREYGDTLETLLDNVSMIFNVSKVLLQKPVKKCVYLSSADVYGRPPKTLPITEGVEVAPSTYYAISKYSSELILQQVCRLQKIPLLTVRFNGVYGPGQKNIGYGANYFIKSILKDRQIEIWGDGKELRDPIYIRDLAKIICQLSLSKSQGVYNIATGKSLSFLEIIEMLKIISPKEFKVLHKKRTSSKFDQMFNITKLTSTLKDLKFTNMEKALSETYQFYANL